MPLLMQSHRDVTGLILKIQPNMVGAQKQQSCPLISAALQFAALPLLGLPNVGWNNSMPHLPNNGLGAMKDAVDPVFDSGDKSELGLKKKEDFSLLQPLSCAGLPDVSRPLSSLSQPETSSCPRRPAPLPTRSPPRLTISIPDQKQLSSSATNLAVPGCGAWANPQGPEPASPVPIPVTPTVTIQNSTSRVSRSQPRSLQRHDSHDSASSSSSLDPLLQVQHDCHCPSSASSSQQHQQPHQHPMKTSPRSSWTVFDDNVDNGGGGSGGGGCSGQNSYRSQNSCSSSLRRSCENSADSKARTGPHEALLTLETKL